MIFDTFMANNELDMLECRLYELQNVPDLVHVVVEADVDHQDHPKPYHITENLNRFAPWADRLRVVRASGLPTVTDDNDPWAREHAQREFVTEAMHDASPDDILFHGDIDEIPTELVARNVRPRGFVAFAQRGHFWAVDWLYPHPWMGTVAGRVSDVKNGFGNMRDCRNFVRPIPNAGWHLSWLGGPEVAKAKVGSFCHPEVLDRIVEGLEADTFLRDGWHVDGNRMTPVDVDRSWPRWIVEGKCPQSWFRPRAVAA